MKKSQREPPGENDDQHRRFVETARALECDEDEAAFDEKLKRIAQTKPAKRIAKAKPVLRGTAKRER
jgi:hypothetical protein